MEQEVRLHLASATNDLAGVVDEIVVVHASDCFVRVAHECILARCFSDLLRLCWTRARADSGSRFSSPGRCAPAARQALQSHFRMVEGVRLRSGLRTRQAQNANE